MRKMNTNDTSGQGVCADAATIKRSNTAVLADGDMRTLMPENMGVTLPGCHRVSLSASCGGRKTERWNPNPKFSDFVDFRICLQSFLHTRVSMMKGRGRCTNSSERATDSKFKKLMGGLLY